MKFQLDKLYITYKRSIAQSLLFDKAPESISKKCYPATDFDFITKHSISISLARMVTDTLIHFDTRKCLRLASFSLYHRVSFSTTLLINPHGRFFSKRTLHF